MAKAGTTRNHRPAKRQRQGAGRVQWYEFVYTLIDLRSFSNLWFWIMLAVQWSMTSHWVMGVPFDMVLRARRKGDAAVEDLNRLAQITAGRLLYIVTVSGLWIAGFAAFALTTLAVLGFGYGIEFAQAVFCLVAPMAAVFGLSLRMARRVAGGQTSDTALVRALMLLRLRIQGVGMVSIFVTSLWGMYQNMNLGALG